MPKFFLYLCYDFFGLVEAGGIAGVALGLNAQSGDFALGLLAVVVDNEVGECDVGTLGGKLQSYCLAYSACCTRDECYFSFK